jgi:hypothetical protein
VVRDGGGDGWLSSEEEELAGVSRGGAWNEEADTQEHPPTAWG